MQIAHVRGRFARYRKRFLADWADFLQREGRVDEAANVLKEVVLRDL